MTIKLGLIGYSHGNGHPYSWSAICNGYSPDHMRLCGFPVIPKYLANQKWPDSRIPDVEVTHVWTQDISQSRRIANASFIKNIVNTPREMIDKIDGLLLARDDAENHLELAAPFIEAGVPIYIDKPIALSLSDLEKLYRLQKYDGQIFTCSALRYANEFKLNLDDRRRIGSIRYVQACTPKNWPEYAAHIIEPTLQIVGMPIKVLSSRREVLARNGCRLSITLENELAVDLTAYGSQISAPIFIRVHGELGWKDLTFVDAFSAFKSALTDFIEGIRTKTCRSPFEFNEQVVSLIESGITK